MNPKHLPRNLPSGWQSAGRESYGQPFFVDKEWCAFATVNPIEGSANVVVTCDGEERGTLTNVQGVPFSAFHFGAAVNLLRDLQWKEKQVSIEVLYRSGQVTLYKHKVTGEGGMVFDEQRITGPSWIASATKKAGIYCKTREEAERLVTDWLCLSAKNSTVS